MSSKESIRGRPMSNVVSLPRPIAMRSRPDPLGFYVRVGFNDHLELLHLIATGEHGMFGFVIDAHYVSRHRELITEARQRGFDVILDPKTQPMALPYGHTDGLGSLPWGGERFHRLPDFDLHAGREKASRIVDFALANNFTQVLGPTHLLSGANDPWLRRDIATMGWTADEIARSGKKLGLLYSLALPMTAFRKGDERRAIVSAIADAPYDSIWVKIENFGDTATGEKTAAYIEGCRDLHARQVPVVGDHIGGLPGLGVLAYGGLGGMAHGVTMQQRFSAASWRRPSQARSGGSSWRVYLPGLDLLLKPTAAEGLLSSPRLKAKCGCHDTHCCPHGVKDMIDRPVRHAMYQRAREIERISFIAPSLRASTYLEEQVRRVSDTVAAVAGLTNLDADLHDSLRRKQGHMRLFRQAMAHFAEASPSESIAMAPTRRATERKIEE
jgi:hypothetical protein